MKRIPLTKGQFAIVDDEDYERINTFKWRARFDQHTNSCYAISSSPRDANGKQHTIWMHREVMNAKPGERVDHINHDTLDQRKPNLRFCTASQNNANQHILSTNTSGYKGVCWNRARRKWQAQLQVNGKDKYIGRFATDIEAALAYDNSAIEHFGRFALTNKMLGLLP